MTIPIILAVTFVVFYTGARWLAPALQTPVAEPPSAAPVLTEPASAVTGESPAFPPAAEPMPAEPMPAEPVPAEVPAVVAEEYVEGELVITSTPAGATVLVNGINRGTTPAQVQYLPAGSYTIRFIYPGRMSVTRRATISAERRKVQVSAELARTEPEPATRPHTEQPAPAP